MEFIFVKSEELQEFEDDIKEMIKFVRHNALLVIFGSLISYLLLVFLLIILP